MKKNVLIVFLLASIILNCKKKTSTKLNTTNKSIFPYSKTFEGHLSFNEKLNVLLEKKGRNTLSAIHFLDLKNDSITFETKKLKLPNFIKDFSTFKNHFHLLNTRPRTSGKNQKSTDIIRKYDSTFNAILQKDMNISKYPSGNSLLINSENQLFYITDGFEFKKNNTLIISELDALLNIINQKTLKIKQTETLYNPLKCILIKDLGLVVISDISDYNKKGGNYRIDVLDLDLNLKWSKDISAKQIISLGHSAKKKCIFLVSEDEMCNIQFWNYSGVKITPTIHNSNSIPNCVTYDDQFIYLLSNTGDKNYITTINLLGNSERKKLVKTDSIKNKHLIRRDNTIFSVSIDNFNKRFIVDTLLNSRLRSN